MNYVVPMWSPPAVSVTNTEAAFPVRRIFCVGRNYAEHAKEMGGNPGREPPFFFCKPADAIVANGSTLAFPLATKNLHHEIELVVAIAKKGANIAREQALEHVYGYAVGIDLTRRDLQGAARDKGRPWDAGKAFDQSAPIAPIRPVSEIGHVERGAIWLKVNGEQRQSADVSDLIWPVPEIIVHLSALFLLRPGDLIFTGTPAGVGAIKPGDHVVGGVDQLGEISIRIAP
jgi:fumarylpyruvate hydrolase